ncbi:MAG: HAD hydrolase-like protein [Paracoccus sp. (in: a-proteobacteria)]|nr:HAD hydrolase-like protein [Paracoccus sp. (in: a-proteobacteria)]
MNLHQQPDATDDRLLPQAKIRMADFLDGDGAETDAVLADLDGCLISGDVVLPGAGELARRAGRRLWIVSNNSADTAETLSQRLSRLGLDIGSDRILLAGEEAVRDLAAAQPGARVALFAAPQLTALATALGLDVCRGQADARLTLLARDPALTLLEIERLMRLLHRGAVLHLANPDMTHPAADGVPVPETGAILAAMRAGLPGLQFVCQGKPSPAMIFRALDRAKVAPERAVFLGDTDETDGRAARAAGVPFVLLQRPGEGGAS